MISPPTPSQTSIARPVLPLAVGPTTARMRFGFAVASVAAWSARRHRPLSSNAPPDLAPRHSNDERPPVRAVPREVDGVERREQRASLFARDGVPGANG